MHDPCNTIVAMILYGAIKLLNGIQYAKMGVYMMFGIKCYMLEAEQLYPNDVAEQNKYIAKMKS